MPSRTRQWRLTARGKSSATFIVAVLLTYPLPCLAELLPSFFFPQSAWSASDIVVASEGDEIDGRLTVIETWKGSLRRGSMLSIPELAEFQDEKHRLVQSVWTENPRVAESPRVVSGQRMILFLKRKFDSAEGVNEEGDAVWGSTSPVGGMRVSTVWVEDGKTYAFVLMFNPGPSLLLDQGKSEAEMKREVGEMTKTQDALLAVRKLENNASRAAQVRRFADSEPFYGQSEAFNILAGCGKEGVSVLVDILRRHDRSMTNYHEIVRAIAVAAGPEADALFTETIRQETVFLRERTRTLPEAWWTPGGLNGTEAAEFRHHYHKTWYVLYHLQKTSSVRSREAVNRLKQFLDSLPEPDEETWVVYLIKACDGVLMETRK